MSFLSYLIQKSEIERWDVPMEDFFLNFIIIHTLLVTYYVVVVFY